MLCSLSINEALLEHSWRDQSLAIQRIIAYWEEGLRVPTRHLDEAMWTFTTYKPARRFQ